MSTFAELGLHPEILSAVVAQGYTQPTPIQEQAIPPVMDGRDVMGAAQTGTGKTAGFALPLLHRLMAFANTSVSPAKHPVRALILTPTRELADQVADNIQKYSSHTSLRHAVIYGGVDMDAQVTLLRQGVEIVVATPGRLLDHVAQKTINLQLVQLLVLDEADRMLDMGFMPDLQRIVELLPVMRQSLLFSATFSKEIKRLAQTFLRDPVVVEVARQNSLAENIAQTVFHVPKGVDKRTILKYLLQEHHVKQAIVFANTKHGAGSIVRYLMREGIQAEAIHGDKTQAERMRVLESFKAGQLNVLIATDVAARGIDIAELPYVINFDLPFSPEDYVHRIGRTGRAGNQGCAWSLCAREDTRLLQSIESLTKTTLVVGSLPAELLVPEVHHKDASRSARDVDRVERPRNERFEGAAEPRFERRERNYGSRSKYDPWFDRPYVPAVSASSNVAAESVSASSSPVGRRNYIAQLPALVRGLGKPVA